MPLPTIQHVYQNHHLDSKRWDAYQPRDSDIIVTTSYKAGTTFTQNILLQMLHGDADELPTLEISPWIDARFMPVPLDEVYEMLEAQSHRRFLKSHLPLDGLPYHPNVKYIIVARDPRDVFMSFLNHYGNYTETAYEIFDAGEVVGAPLPRYDGDVRGLWRRWITSGWFDWESEGYPFWGNMHHTQTYWDFKDLPNFLFMHYADMLADLEGSVRRIAGFIDHPLSDTDVARIVERTSFSAVKKQAQEADANPDPDEPAIFKGGQSAFFFKGTNGRWKEILNDDDLALYEATRSRVLSDDCARWLEEGGPV